MQKQLIYTLSFSWTDDCIYKHRRKYIPDNGLRLENAELPMQSQTNRSTTSTEVAHQDSQFLLWGIYGRVEEELQGHWENERAPDLSTGCEHEGRLQDRVLKGV